MANQAAPAAQATPPRRRRWLKRLSWTAGIFVSLLVVFYFVATSAAFLKSVVLPRAGKALNADITLGEASISPFSEARLKNLVVRTRGKEPLLVAEELHATYSLWDILKGNINVQSVTLKGATVNWIEDKDGDNNLDPILKALTSDKKEKSKSPAPKVNIGEILAENVTIRSVKQHKDGTQDVLEIKQPKLSVQNIRNNDTGKLSLAADIKMDNRPPAPEPASFLDAGLVGDFTFKLSEELMPVSIQGKSTLMVRKADGALKDLTNVQAELLSDMSPTAIKEISLSFKRGQSDLGRVIVDGPIDLLKQEGTVNVRVLAINKEVLNLAAATTGIDFGSTILNSTNKVVLSSAGAQILASGDFHATQMSLTQKGLTTPTIDSKVGYEVSVDRTGGAAVVKQFSLTAQEDTQVFLQGSLNRPMTLAWGSKSQAVGDSDLKVVISQFNLAGWKAFLGTIAPAGEVNGELNLISKNAGKQLVIDLQTDLRSATILMGSNRLEQVSGKISVRGQADDFQKITLSQFHTELTQKGQPVMTAEGSGKMDLSTKAADVQLKVTSDLPALISAMELKDFNVTSGKFGLDGRITQNEKAQTVTGKFTIENLSGRFGGNRVQQFAATSDLDISLQAQDLDVKKLAGTFSEGGKPGGGFDVKARYDIGKEKGNVDLKISNLNENGVRPFLAAALGDKQLVSVSINGTASAKYDKEGESSIKSDIEITNLVVKDPENKLPQTPLETKLKLDGGLKNQVVDIREAMITLAPTARAKNQLTMKGKIGLAPSNNVPSTLLIESESLDVTPYYNLFAKKETTPPDNKEQPSKSKPQGTISKNQPEEEPAAVKLPVSQGRFEVKIGAFYLDEISITNLTTVAQVNSGKVQIQPLQLSVNGKPVSGNVNLDLSVPGYIYDINLTANQIPIAPFVNTFMPEDKGRYTGDIVLDSAIKGRGVTGASMQKNLSGKLDFSFTNANIQLSGPKFRAFFTPIALALQAPELLETPINWVQANSTIGDGRIVVSNLQMLSAVFVGKTGGTIPIQAVLTESPIAKWPMNFSLKRSLAEKARLVSKPEKEANANPQAPATPTPPPAEYVPLPNFIRVVGTLGEPKPEIDKLALAGGLLEKFGSKIPGVDDKTGKLLEGIGGVLGGEKGTNSGSLFDLFPKKEKKK